MARAGSRPWWWRTPLAAAIVLYSMERTYGLLSWLRRRATRRQTRLPLSALPERSASLEMTSVSARCHCEVQRCSMCTAGSAALLKSLPSQGRICGKEREQQLCSAAALHSWDAWLLIPALPCAQGECVCGLRDSASAGVATKAAPIELSWADLTCDVLNVQTMQPKRVLHGASGAIRPGELAALVGPSGAGARPQCRRAPCVPTRELHDASGRPFGFAASDVTVTREAVCTRHVHLC